MRINKSYTKSEKVLILIGVVILGGIIFMMASNTRSSVATPPKSVDPFAGLQSQDFKEEGIFWNERIQEKGASIAYKEFLDTYKDDDYGKQHTLAHIFGILLYENEGLEGVKVCDSSFAFGCYHSFFGKAIIENGISVIVDLDKECIAAYGEKGLGCPHGIGHGVLSYVGADNFNEALHECATLNWKEPIGGCTSGVFMEYNFQTMESPDSAQIRPIVNNDPHYPCTAVDEKFTEACYFEQPAWWRSTYGRDDAGYSKIGRFCGEIADQLDKEACFRGTGNVAAGLENYDIVVTTHKCSLMPERYGKVLCLQGAAWIMSAQKEFADTWEGICADMKGRDLQICLSGKDFI